MAISTRAATLKQGIGAALNKELEIARKASSGERANEVKDGIQTRKKGNSFLYEFEEMTAIHLMKVCRFPLRSERRRQKEDIWVRLILSLSLNLTMT